MIFRAAALQQLHQAGSDGPKFGVQDGTNLTNAQFLMLNSHPRRKPRFEFERFDGVPLNSRAICAFRYTVIRLWRKWLSRRSQTAYVTWDRMKPYVARWVPPAVICHPYPSVRFGG